MGKPTGFMEYQRVNIHHSDPGTRVTDYREFMYELPEAERQRQGARCMDCGVPFCQSDTGCPVSNLIPEWNDLVYRGRYRNALERLLQTNNFPEFTGLVCPAPCESACVLSIISPAVTIKANEYFIAERGFEEGWIVPRLPARQTHKKVAIIGSGPAGLAAAEQLNRAGHSIRVYERDDRPGGILMYGIPNMKLDKAKIERRIQIMREEGVVFLTGTDVGKRIDSQQIVSENDAILLACGARKPRDLEVPGRNLPGIHFAMEFLTRNTKSLLDSNLRDNTFISAKNKNVIVVGGGDTGNDCIATAVRHGCKSVLNFEILPKPPIERAPDDLWPAWPRILRQDYGHQEAMHIFSRDPREYCIRIKECLGTGGKRLEGVRTVRVEWKSTGSGRYELNEIPGTEEEYPADLVLLAMGFLGPESALVDQLGLEKDPRSNILTDPHNFMASKS
ncbi:MAG TPA: glutamate synthase small subunit, partial [Spirochaetia bacterium]|nr:glutamate synthase small subunit [Spirochaetia bacterium]